MAGWMMNWEGFGRSSHGLSKGLLWNLPCGTQLPETSCQAIESQLRFKPSTSKIQFEAVPNAQSSSPNCCSQQRRWTSVQCRTVLLVPVRVIQAAEGPLRSFWQGMPESLSYCSKEIPEVEQQVKSPQPHKGINCTCTCISGKLLDFQMLNSFVYHEETPANTESCWRSTDIALWVATVSRQCHVGMIRSLQGWNAPSTLEEVTSCFQTLSLCVVSL
jgi:hypothetical protein